MAYKPDKSTKHGSKGKGSGRNSTSRRDAPVSATVSGKLRGGNRNVSATRTPKSRPGYPHLLEAATSTMHLATAGGLSPSWRATFINVLTRPAMETYQQFAEYNCSLVDASRERLLRRHSLQRFLTPHTRGAVEFFSRNGQNALISETTGTDGILAVEAWHKEFSAEFGRFVKFMEFNLDVNAIFHEQRGHGDYGLGPGYRKPAGQPYTPYERLYNTLYNRLQPVIASLNIPSHLLANMTLGDVVRHTLNLLAPSSIGLDSNTWTMPTGFNIHSGGYQEGYNSLDFGALSDADGNPRYLVQVPDHIGGLETLSSNDDHMSTIRSARVKMSDMYHLGPNPTVSLDAALVAARDAMRADLPAYLAGAETADDVYIQGVNVRDLPGSADLLRQTNITVGGVPMMTMSYMHGLSSSWSTSLTGPFTTSETVAQLKDPTAFIINGLQSTKLWTASPLLWLDYLHAVSAVLPPEYLATNVGRTLEFSAAGGLTASLAYGELVDLINLNAEFKMRFNPVKLIEQNNGPFGRDSNGQQFSDAWRENNWHAPAKIGGNTYARQLTVLEQIFSGTTFETGYGTAAETVASIFALLNPRWAESLFSLSNSSSVDKRERFVTVPANRAGIASGYISEEGEFAMAHHLMILNRLIGTFACYSTMPFADLGYGTGSTYYRGGTNTVSGYGEAASNYYNLQAGGAPTVGSLNLSQLGYGNQMVTLPASQMDLFLGWDTVGDFDGLQYTLAPKEQNDGTHRFTIADATLTVDAFSPLNAALIAECPLIADGTMRVTHNNAVSYYAILGSRTINSGATHKVELTVSDLSQAGTIGSLIVSYPDTSSGLTFIGLGAPTPHADLTAAIAASGIANSAWDLANTPDDAAFKAALKTNIYWSWVKDGTAHDAAAFKTAFGLAAQHDITDVQFEGFTFSNDPNPNWHVRKFVQLEDASANNVRGTLTKVGGGAAPVADWLSGANSPVVTADADFGNLNATIGDMSLAILFKYFGYFADDGANGAARASGLWISTGSNRSKLTTIGCGNTSFDGTRYWMSQNEDVFFDARRNEFDAAVYDYSGLRLFNLSLNSKYGGYPYHGTPEGFMRDLILELTPAIVDYHFQSASPFLIPGLARLKVDKSVYNPQAYALMYQQLVGLVGNNRTELTIEDLRRAQDVLVRRNQGGN